ncbi:hypothetical protein Tco_0060401 [Tanacetum coccineum]
MNKALFYLLSPLPKFFVSLVCMYSSDWFLANLHLAVDSNRVYRTPLDDLVTVRNTVFIGRTEQTRLTRNKELIHRDPFQMKLFEMLPRYKKWEEILKENAICLAGNKDHPNMCHLPSREQGPPQYVHLHKMVQPSPVTDDHFLANHVMVPLTEGRAKRLMIDGKIPRPLTDSSDKVEADEDNPISNYQLNHVAYMEQLPKIPKETEEFKQTKGMFKCLAHFLTNMGKKKK